MPARRPKAPSAAPEAPLAEYDRKRDFTRTPEPAAVARPRPRGPLTFVVQKHAARQLHYDVRLEWDGVMASWAVPKGPSAAIGTRQLAVHVEDHPLDYAIFEGVIPKGAYGAGHVIVWDAGTYSPDDDGVLSFGDPEEAERRMRAGFAAGKISVRFRGKKLKGSWALVRTDRVESGKEQWLLLKHRDEAADPARELIADGASVRSQLTVEDLQRGVLPDPARHVTPVQPADLHGARAGDLPRDLRPMQAEARAQPFNHADWRFEPKIDGVRALAFLSDGQVTLRSRGGLDMEATYPRVAQAVQLQPAHSLVLDGEITALDERGLPSFELLQERIHLHGAETVAAADRRIPVVYYVFDLLYLDGVDLRGVTLDDRLDLRARVVMPTQALRLLEPFDTDGVTAFAAAQRLGIEGIVAKRGSSTYESGRRSPHWLKIKERTTDEFVVGGYADGEGARARTFGSLIVGSYDEQGRLLYNTHVGSGFDDRMLAILAERLRSLAVPDSPFAELVPTDGHPAAHWVRPELVVEVEYAERTREGHLRAPVFRRVREDKVPADTAVSAGVAPKPTPKPTRPRTAVAAPATETDTVLAQLDVAASRKTALLILGEHELKITNLDKTLWPATAQSPAYTKRDLLRYFVQVSPWLLPHLRDRPLTMTRYPHGVTGNMFYQKHYDDAPPFVERILAHSETKAGDQTYLVCNNLATLLWLGQVADLALHTSLARISPEPDGHHLSTDFTGSRAQIESSLLNYPDFLLFDLDPYTYAGTERAGDEPELNQHAWEQVSRVARWVKQLLDQASLASFVKTSGATGLHIYVPVTRHYDYATIRGVCETFGEFLRKEHGADVTTEWAVQKRAGKVFFDHNQNARFKNLAAPYSPRAKPGAPVSMPIRWDEVGSVYPTDFTLSTAIERLQRNGDVWAGILDAKQDLQRIIGGGS